MKLLPFNPNTLIKTYSHHAFVSSVLDNPVLLAFSMSDYSENEKYEIDADNVVVRSDKNYFTICSNGMIEDSSSVCVTKKAGLDDSLTSTIFTIKNMQRGAKVIFYISSKPKVTSYSDMLYSLTIHRYGFTTDERGKNRKNYEFSLNDYSYFKVIRKNDRISFWCCNDTTGNWIELDDCVLHDNLKDYYLGLYAKCLDNYEYFEWIMQNYLHISFDPIADISGVYLDYFLAPSKNMRYEFLYPSQFIDVTYIPSGIISKDGLKDFVISCLDKGYYVALAQDEYYIPNRTRYHKIHYYHHNLFWGYDYEEKEFYIAGYRNTFISSKISFSEFEHSGISKEANIMLYRKEFNDCEFVFKKELFVQALKMFLSGENPYSQLENIFTTRDMFFGMKVFDIMANTKKGMWVACFDNRAAYLLCEHASVWKIRIQYLEKKGILNKCPELMHIVDELIGLCQKYLFFVQKSMVMSYSISFDSADDLWEKTKGKNIIAKAAEYVAKISYLERELIENVLAEIEKNEV